MKPLGLTGLDGGHVEVSGEQLDALAGRLAGPLLVPGDEGFAEAVLIWNALAAREPALVARPESARDVAAVVDFAREHRILLSVKGGGHHIAGIALAHGGLTLDLSGLREVRVDPAARLVHAGPGCRLGDVDRATQEHGLATVLGFVSEVGIAGLTLGGGFGYLMRRFGWAADNLHEIEIVTADGEVRVASRDENPELFWALRGGSGNFGVVTRFSYRLHEVGPTITGGLIAWGGDQAQRILAGYRDLTASAPRELTAAMVLRTAPPLPFLPSEWHFRPIVAMLVCHSGADPAADIAAIRALGEPIADLLGERPYVEQQSIMDGTEPTGQCYYWKTEFLPELSPGFLAAFRSGASRVPSVASESVIFHIGGAVNEFAGDDGAVGNRDARYVTGFAGAWSPEDEALGGTTLAWVHEAYAGIREYGSGNYVNFQLADDDSTRTAAAYGRNLERLRRAKRAYDPTNLFRRNRNIQPAVRVD